MSHCGVPRNGRTLGNVTRLLALALLLLALSAGAARASGGDDGGVGGGEVRVAAACGRGVTGSLRLRAEDGGIRVRFELKYGRRGTWQITIVHEQRVASRATRHTTRSDDSVEVRRTLPDLEGSDNVVVRAWGPHGLGCRASATLRS